MILKTERKTLNSNTTISEESIKNVYYYYDLRITNELKKKKLNYLRKFLFFVKFRFFLEMNFKFKLLLAFLF